MSGRGIKKERGIRKKRKCMKLKQNAKNWNQNAQLCYLILKRKNLSGPLKGTNLMS
jgi:hypothetical protein